MFRTPLILFGHPGAGKSYAGEVLAHRFGYHLFDGDTALPEEMKDALKREEPITELMRDRFADAMLRRLKELEKQYDRVALAQTFIKERMRARVLEVFPDTVFFLINTPVDVRETRLRKRKDYPLDVSYARSMVAQFDPPDVPHTVVDNATDGNEALIAQFAAIISST